MTPDRIREFCARSEDPDLDFKGEQYDWGADGNNELAKDVMAMANVLHAAAEPAHILIGVQELQDHTGEIVGVDRSVLLDDALMHQKIEHLLNVMPTFKSHSVEVDGRWVGVIEIRPGGRPFYALRSCGSRHKLRRNVAMYRASTGATEASPAQIIEWAKVDGRLESEAMRLQLDWLRSQVDVAPRLFGEGGSGNSTKVLFVCRLRNAGQVPFEVEGATAIRRFTDETVRGLSTLSQPDVLAELRQERATQAAVLGTHFAAGEERDVHVTCEFDDSERSLMSFASLHFQRVRALTDGRSDPPLIQVDVTVSVRSAQGRRGIATHAMRWPS